MYTLAQDLIYALRVLRRAPGFAAVSVIVLALGIGANSAIFSLVDAALLRPLPFSNPQELVKVWEHPPGRGRNSVAPLNYSDWREQNHVFASLAAVSGGSRTLKTSSGAEQLIGQAVTPEYFGMLGVRPILGRDFTLDDERRRTDVVLISERIWRERFGADPKLVGSAISLDGKPCVVAGVIPASFQLLWKSDLWTIFPVEHGPEQRKMHYLQVIGRLKPGVTMQEAQANMDVIAGNIARLSPETNKGWGVLMAPLRNAIVGAELRASSLVLAGVVGFVLLMACANIANLMLARGARRAREMAVRASLGAGQGRLIRQLLTESLLLSAGGGVAGIALARVVLRAAPAFLPAGTLPSGLGLALDFRVAAFAAAVTILTGLLFGIAPAWQAARANLTEVVRAGGRGSTGAAFRGSLATLQVAIAVMLVAGAGLLLRTLDQLNTVDPGFHAPNVLTARLLLPINRYPTQAQLGRFYQSAQRELDAIPGVQSVAFGNSLPLTGFDIGQGFEIAGQPKPKVAAHYQMVSAKYFATLGIPLLAGRAFDEHDIGTSRPVAIVNQEFARRYFPQGAVGGQVRVSAMDMRGPIPVDREIVGVIGQVKVEGPEESENALEIYVPLAQNPWFSTNIVAGAPGDPAALAPALREAIARVDKDLPLTSIRTMDQIAEQSVARPRFRAELVSGFASLAALLAAVGVFGVLAFSVSQRTREFGIRMAIGARASDVLRMVASAGLRIAAAGVLAGLAGAALLVRFLSALLFGVRPLDPVSFLAAPAVLAAVTLIASVIPALRAARVDPAVVLREE